ncbi:MAG: STAS domain-containing protein [Terracidiphilus sp.]|nr:STAS domain-containing protein [Terracidiphilus sp.]MDR3797182.1 STAS domain-containing protein [Terracidiphilus sp.]
MGTFSWQTWNSGPFSIERKPGGKPGTVVLCFHGPFTTRDAYSSLPTMSLKQVLELEPAPGEDPPVKNILDLTGCPFMDSSGLGIIVSHMVRCNKKGMKMIAAGMTPRVREVFRLTRVDHVVPIAASVEEAEAL